MFCKYCNRENPRDSTCDGRGKQIGGNGKIEKNANECRRAPASRSVPTPKARRKAARKKRTLVAVVASAIVLCVAGVGGFFYWQTLCDDYFEEKERDYFISGDFYFRIQGTENLEQRDCNTSFHNNVVHIVAEVGTSRDSIERLARDYDAEITSFRRCERFGDRYTFTFSRNLYVEELESLVDKFSSFTDVNRANLSIVPYHCPTTATDTLYPADPRWERNWGLRAIGAPIAWSHKDEMQEVRVLVCDNGFYLNHEDLNFRNNPSGDDNSHGTHVAGVIGGTWNNVGISGVAPKCLLYGVNFSVMSTEERVAIIERYVREKGVQVINISYSTAAAGLVEEFAAYRGNARARENIRSVAREYEEMILRLIDSGYEFIIVTSSGNQHKEEIPDSDSNLRFISCSNTEIGWRSPRNSRERNDSEYGIDGIFDPLALMQTQEARDRIIVVGGVRNTYLMGEELLLSLDLLAETDIIDEWKKRESSQRGPLMDVSAPGSAIYSTYRVDTNHRWELVWDGWNTGLQRITTYYSRYDVKGGTSMAAPHVSGVAAMIFGVNPNLTGAEVKQIIVETSVGTNNVIDAGAAVRMALGYDLDDEAEVEEPEIEEPEAEDSEEREVDTDAFYQALIAYHRFLTNPQSMELLGIDFSWNTNTLRYAMLIDFDNDGIPELLIIPPNPIEMWFGLPFAIIGYSGEIDYIRTGMMQSDGGHAIQYTLATTYSEETLLIHNIIEEWAFDASVPIGEQRITRKYYRLIEGVFTLIPDDCEGWISYQPMGGVTIIPDDVPDNIPEMYRIEEFPQNWDVLDLIDYIEYRLTVAGFDLTEPITSEDEPIVVEGRLTQAEAEAIIREQLSHMNDLTIEFRGELIIPYPYGQWEELGGASASEHVGKEAFTFAWYYYADNGFQYWNSVAVTKEDGVLLQFGSANRVF